MEDSKLRRAGLDYHDLALTHTHQSLDQALEHVSGRIWALTGHATKHYTDVQYADGDALLFGCEPDGLPEEVMQDERITDLLRIHMLPDARSLNLANSAAIVLYEAWRQLGFPGGV